MAKLKYEARYDGKLVGTRTSTHRIYTHAIVARRDFDKAMADALSPDYARIERSNFAYAEKIVASEGVKLEPMTGESDLRSDNDWGDYRGKWANGETYVASYTKTDIEKAKADIAGGFAAYQDRCRNARISSLRREVELGGFDLRVIEWCGRPDLAAKAMAKNKKSGIYDIVHIVEAVRV